VLVASTAGRCSWSVVVRCALLLLLLGCWVGSAGPTDMSSWVRVQCQLCWCNTGLVVVVQCLPHTHRHSHVSHAMCRGVGVL
jgi:hypothetical protein